MGATAELIRNVVMTDFSTLPQETIEKTKEFILDSFGVAVAGSSASGCKDVIDQILSWGGKPESTIWIQGSRVSSYQAALLNAMMTHARDFDDTHEGIGAHCCTSVLPAALAVTEQQGGVSGEKLITAVAIGVDVLCRLGQSINLHYAWHPTSILGTYGSVVAAGKILELDEKKMINALGIAHAHIPGGNRQARKDGALTKRMQPGFAAMGAVLSANFALKGITGSKATLEGSHGFFNLYKNHEEKYNPDKSTQKLLDKIGKRFEIVNLSMKPYSSCRSSHPAIDAALGLTRSQRIDPDDIEKVNVYVSSITMEKVGKPFEIRTNPQVDAQFSIPYTVAVALLRGKVILSDFEMEKINSPEVLNFTKKIKCITRLDFKGRTPITVEIKTKKGQILSKTVKLIKGHPDKPLTEEERLEKFCGCWNYAAKPLSEINRNKMIEAINRLEKMKNVNRLIEFLI